MSAIYYHPTKTKVNEAEIVCMVSCLKLYRTRANKQTRALLVAPQQPIRPRLSSEIGMGDFFVKAMYEGVKCSKTLPWLWNLPREIGKLPLALFFYIWIPAHLFLTSFYW